MCTSDDSNKLDDIDVSDDAMTGNIDHDDYDENSRNSLFSPLS